MEMKVGKMYNIETVTGEKAKNLTLRQIDVLGVCWFEERFTRGMFPLNKKMIKSFELVKMEKKKRKNNWKKHSNK